AGRARGGADRRLGDAGRRAAEDGHLRNDSFLFAALSRGGAPRSTVGSGAGDYRDYLRRAGGAGAAKFKEIGGVLFGEPSWFCGTGNFCVPQYFDAGSGVPDAGAWNFHRRAVFAGGNVIRPAAYI